MALSWHILDKNYTTNITPQTKEMGTGAIHYYFDADFTCDYEPANRHISLECDLLSYDSTAFNWYPMLVIQLGENPNEGFSGFYFSPGFGVFGNIDNVVDGTHYDHFEQIGADIGSHIDASLTIFRTNIPIVFLWDEVPYLNYMHYDDWVLFNKENPPTESDFMQIYNIREIVPEDFMEYWTKVTTGNYTITESGKTLNGVNSYKWETIKTSKEDRGKIAWAISSDGKTATLVLEKRVVGDIWSDSRGYQWVEAVSPHFLSLPYEWDGVTLGTFDIATSFKYGVDTNIPIFDNRDIQAYLDGDKDITDSKGYSGTNTTGTPENETDFPDVTMSMNSVSSLILMTSSGLATLNSNIFDVQTFGTDLHDLIDTLSSGWQGFLSTAETALLVDSIAVMRPMEMFNSIFYYPFDVTNITTSTAITALNCGLRTIIAPTGSKVVTSCNGSINLGSVTVERTWFDYRDLTNMRCEIYLPYIGYATLNLNEIIGKSVNVKYFVDLYSGACVAVITANGRMIAYKQGMIGVNMAITPESTNGLISNVAGVVASAVTQNYVGVATSAVGAVNNFLSASASSCPVNSLGLHLPQYAFFVFESDNINETQNEVVLDGKPSDVSASIGSFSGFLKVRSVELQCSGATDNEKEMIKNLLYSGIYI